MEINTQAAVHWMDESEYHEEKQEVHPFDSICSEIFAMPERLESQIIFQSIHPSTIYSYISSDTNQPTHSLIHSLCVSGPRYQ